MDALVDAAGRRASVAGAGGPGSQLRVDPGPGLPGLRAAPRWRPGERLEHLFEERCDRHAGDAAGGDHLAVDAGDVVLTYDQLDARANQLARHLLARGARPGDRIGAAVRPAPCTPTSACWPCSRSTPPTCRSTSASRPTGWPTSCRTPGCGSCSRCRTCATGSASSRATRPVPRRGGSRSIAAEDGRRLTDAETGEPGRRALLHHLHLGLDRPAQGRGGRARQHLQLRPRRGRGLRHRGRATASTRA